MITTKEAIKILRNEWGPAQSGAALQSTARRKLRGALKTACSVARVPSRIRARWMQSNGEIFEGYLYEFMEKLLLNMPEIDYRLLVLRHFAKKIWKRKLG